MKKIQSPSKMIANCMHVSVCHSRESGNPGILLAGSSPKDYTRASADFSRSRRPFPEQMESGHPIFNFDFIPTKLLRNAKTSSESSFC